VNEPQLVAALRSAGCVFAEDEARLLLDEATSPAELMAWAARRMAGEPLEQIVGWAAFAGLRIAVDPRVFVPRRRSELVVEVASRQPAALVVDLCCGTGALGAALAARWPAAEVYAADSDPVAVAGARRNLPPERVFEGDLYAALPEDLRGRVDLLVVNAPYVPTDAIATMPREARDHEHRMALDGGADGLDVQRRVAAGAPDWLSPGGRLVLETGRAQAELTAALLSAVGLAPSVETDDEIGATAVLGRARTGTGGTISADPGGLAESVAEPVPSGPSQPRLDSPPRPVPVSPRRRPPSPTPSFEETPQPWPSRSV
jgi:release factor glutamine methyltransferase